MVKVWCKHCKRNQLAYSNYFESGTCSVCCLVCGRICSHDYYTQEPTFVKGPGGESRLAGSYVRSIQRDYSESLERSFNNGKAVIHKLSSDLEMNNDSLETNAAHFYQLAAEKGFTRGRRIDQVAAACLYIACRVDKNPKPYFLIEFSEKLRINVYVLGAVFLQLCELLRLAQHDFVQKPVDPSLFIDLFTTRLLGERNKEVSRTALRIIASMKRDWMQTGRKPSGLCGAAIYISALSQGHTYSKSDVVNVVHMCEATLTKRLIEFENTNSGSLTIEEFINNAMELEKDAELEKELRSHKLSGVGSKSSGAAELLCKHKGSSKPPFPHGLCSNCYDEFIELSGGLQGGSYPPAFQHVERERTVEVSAEETNESDDVDTPHQDRTNSNHATETCTDVKAFAKANQKVNNSGKAESADSEIRNTAEGQARVESAFDMSNKNNAVNTEENESDCLSDIDDIEVNEYLYNKEESHYKKIIWEKVNKEYLEEQAAKEAAAPAAKPRKNQERQQKRAAEAKNATPAKTAAEATRQMLTKKRLSSKINYDVLEQLFNGDDTVPDSKKSRIGFQDDRDATKQDLSENEHERSTMDNSDEYGLGDEDAEESDGEDEHESYFGNQDDAYDFDNNDNFDDY